jgi:hypothetical protein
VLCTDGIEVITDTEDWRPRHSQCKTGRAKTPGLFLFVARVDCRSSPLAYFFRARFVVFLRVVLVRFLVDLAAEVGRFLVDFLAALRFVVFFLAVPVFALVDFLAVDFLAILRFVVFFLAAPAFALVDFLAVDFFAVLRLAVFFLAVPAFAFVDFAAFFFVVRDFVALLFAVFAVAISFGSRGYRLGYPLNPDCVAPAPIVELQPVFRLRSRLSVGQSRDVEKVISNSTVRLIVSFEKVVKQKPLPDKRLSFFVPP